MKQQTLIVDVEEFGAFLSKRRKRILVKRRTGVEEVPMRDVREIVISSKVTITSELIKECVSQGIGILFTTRFGKPVAMMSSAKVGGTVANRKKQYESLEGEKGLQAAREVLRGKIRNQVSNLKYYSKAKRRSEEAAGLLYRNAEELKESLGKLEAANSYDELRWVEAETSQLYWDSMRLVFEDWGFEGRREDNNSPVNIALNVCYNLLSCEVWRNVLYFSLDPFAGYLHTDRPGKLSLVYDLMEPYRPIVDRFVASQLRSMRPVDFTEKQLPRTLLKLKRSFFQDFLERRLFCYGRRVRVRYSIFHYVQSFVSFLNDKGRFLSPYLEW